MVNINSTLLWQVFNFLVLLWLLKRYLYGPITEMLDKRKQKVNSDLDQAQQEREEAAALKEKYENKLREAREKSEEIVNEAEKRGKKRAREIVEEAETDAIRVKESKMAEVEQARREAADELRNHVAAISLMAAGKLINEKIDQKKHEELINEYIENLDREKLGEVQ